MGAARFFRRTGEGVYDMDDLARATAKMAGFVAGPGRGGEAVARCSALGYSNGANILASVLFAAPDLFDAAVLMHPLIPFEPDIKGGLAGRRVLITAGRRDPICPPELTSAARRLFARRGRRCHGWNGMRAATRCGRRKSRRCSGFFAGSTEEQAK